MPVRIIVTSGTTADCSQAVALIDGINAQYLLADRGYDSNKLIKTAIEAGYKIVIPPRKTDLSRELMTSIFIVCVISSKMLF